MKKWIWIPILIIIILLLGCQKQDKEESTSLDPSKEKEEIYPVAQEVQAKILASLDNLEQGNVAQGAGLLLEAVLLTRPSEDMPPGFEDKIKEAKEQFQRGNFKEGVELVSGARLLIKPETDMLEKKEKEYLGAEQALEKDEIAPIAEIFRNKILAAQDQFKKGSADEGVLLILEALQLLAPRPD